MNQPLCFKESHSPNTANTHVLEHEHVGIGKHNGALAERGLEQSRGRRAVSVIMTAGAWAHCLLSCGPRHHLHLLTCTRLLLFS